jgi:hypothetical protein
MADSTTTTQLERDLEAQNAILKALRDERSAKIASHQEYLARSDRAILQAEQKLQAIIESIERYKKYLDYKKVSALEELKGMALPFHGVYDQCFRIGHTTWEVEEDPDDGYRSYFRCARLVSEQASYKMPFFVFPIDVVRIEEFDTKQRNGWSLVSVVDGHEWLTFGTDNRDDYYPCFFFNYSPRAPKN